MIKIDEYDLKIIEILKQDARSPARIISKKIDLPTTTVYNRIRKLEENGIIKRYTIDLDHRKMGMQLITYSFLHYDISVWGEKSTREDLKRHLLALPNVEEVKYIIGQYDILLKFRLHEIDDLNNVLLNNLRKIPGIGQTETFIVLEDVL